MDAVRIDVLPEDFEQQLEKLTKAAEQHLNFVDVNDAVIFVQRALHRTSVSATSNSDAEEQKGDAQRPGPDVPTKDAGTTNSSGDVAQDAGDDSEGVPKGVGTVTGSSPAPESSHNAHLTTSHDAAV